MPPDGFNTIEGDYDHLSQRVDLAVMAQIDTLAAVEEPDTAAIDELRQRLVIDYQPPQPSPDHEWNAASRRWVLMADAAAAREKDAVARAAMIEAEIRSLRALREAVLALIDPQSEAARRLAEVEREIEARRQEILPPRPQIVELREVLR